MPHNDINTVETFKTAVLCPSSSIHIYCVKYVSILIVIEYTIFAGSVQEISVLYHFVLVVRYMAPTEFR